MKKTTSSSLLSDLSEDRIDLSSIAAASKLNALDHELQDANSKLHTKIEELDTITDYLKGILDNIVQGILFIDINGIITTYNRAAENILGIPCQKILFQNFWSHFNDDVFGFSMRETLEKKKAHNIVSTSYTSPANQHCELEIVTTFVLKDSSPTDTPSQDPTSPAPTQGMIVMLKDVTEIRQLQLLADRTSRLKELGEMAAHVAHEIRNPLGGIKGFASLLKRDLADSPSLRQMAEYIVEGTDNLNRLVNQILHYSRPIQLQLEKSDLVALLHEIKNHVLADDTISKQSIEISIDAALPELLINLDPSMFKSALLNLLVNAIQAMPKGGNITMSVEKNIASLS